MRRKLVVALGVALRKARMHHGLSQEELAGRVGLHRNTIGLVERGEFSVSVETLEMICSEMGYSPWQMLLEAEFEVG